MDHLALLKQYIREKEDSDIVSHGFPFVTISRQSGAGGHMLAKAILTENEKQAKIDEMFHGWQVFDREVCALVAQDPELNGSFDAMLTERYQTETQQIVHDMLNGRSRQYVMYKRIFEIVRILATLGKTIIIGRGGECVTRKMPQGIHIRLIASERTRIQAIMEDHHFERKEAEKVMHQQDKERARLIQDYFSADIDNPLLYDAIFNIDKLSTSDLAAVIVQMIKLKAKKARP
jgi:cytidylate kinase